uniref:Uncharacterized protein n=1 Tax=Anguilla anguilla TaxID=7936 RepID=A0A0E9RI59_ANGAN
MGVVIHNEFKIPSAAILDPVPKVFPFPAGHSSAPLSPALPHTPELF